MEQATETAPTTDQLQAISQVLLWIESVVNDNRLTHQGARIALRRYFRDVRKNASEAKRGE